VRACVRVNPPRPCVTALRALVYVKSYLGYGASHMVGWWSGARSNVASRESFVADLGS